MSCGQLLIWFVNKNSTKSLGAKIILYKRVKGIEPSYQAWEACVLPLNYTRSYKFIECPLK